MSSVIDNDPEGLTARGRARLQRLMEAARAHSLALEPGDWPGDAEQVLGFSDFISEQLLAHPHWCDELFGAHGSVHSASPDYARSLADALDQALAEEADPQTLGRILRGYRGREAIRIAWRDICGLADFAETTRDLTTLADQILQQSMSRLQTWQTARLGTPVDAQGEAVRMVVLGLGKLGAGELNFSSDIDLIFCFEVDGEVRDNRRGLTNHEWFNRLGRELIKIINERTVDGYVFRVDMRLRPFGGAGPLSMSFAAMEAYYETHGRDWERYALIRARPVAGDLRAGEDLLRSLRPFVFRRYVDFGTLASMREMKQLIAAEVQRRELQDHVKLGPGGIREIEFTVQAFQLAQGGRIKSLRDREVLKVLDTLRQRDFLPEFAASALKHAYVFLRTLEHRLQQVADLQTHKLPEGDSARQRLAGILGHRDWAALAEQLDEVRRCVREQFDQVLGTGEPDAPVAGGSEPLAGLLSLSDEEQWPEQALRAAGFDPPDAAISLLQGLVDAFAVRAMDDISRKRLEQLLPDLLRAIGQCEDPLQTLRRVLAIVKTVARRSVYLSLLGERPIALSQLVKLCAASPWIAREIERHPVLLDELLDPRSLYAPPGKAQLRNELQTLLDNAAAGGTETEMASLREFHHAQVLRVAAADLGGAIPLAAVSDHLTYVAETLVAAGLQLAERDLRGRFGIVPLADSSDTPAGVLAVGYGKLGGWELGYGSDLDLVFIHADSAPASNGERRSLDAGSYFARLVQRFIHLCSTATPQGRCYEVDTRLRPNGNAGMLCNTLGAVERYLMEDAWTWEHQALIRARPIAGDENIASDFERMRMRVLCKPRDEEQLRQEVRDMRTRMQRELGSKQADRFDLKQDPGGIADIEFIVQYLTLLHAAALGEWLKWSDNLRLLEGLADRGLLDAADARMLTDNYLAYRNRTHRLALQELPAVVDAQEFTAERESVRDAWRRILHDSDPD
ncbi:MAG: bifunctional [glutamate--ammonia ligase]-adenylyl-L-tyrosine phosphorylase/[glutamate--ammonia-ligase] adenylyltransferase [Gammaproteobacteria bacterium]|nr:bifunctional [glutamate--ammonia ligase]-adenylyl-L-tyrosine phosphorylase/[glutamate--ammonia-ligase] adenylyltransferase [Gammaproteobacteria bacterium]